MIDIPIKPDTLRVMLCRQCVHAAKSEKPGTVYCRARKMVVGATDRACAKMFRVREGKG